MSSASRPIMQSVTVCDICDEMIDTECNPYRRSSLHSMYKDDVPDASKVTHLTMWWDPRNWRRGPSHEEIAKDPILRHRRWDMHTECLIRAVEAYKVVEEEIK